MDTRRAREEAAARPETDALLADRAAWKMGSMTAMRRRAQEYQADDACSSRLLCDVRLSSAERCCRAARNCGDAKRAAVDICCSLWICLPRNRSREAEGGEGGREIRYGCDGLRSSRHRRDALSGRQAALSMRCLAGMSGGCTALSACCSVALHDPQPPTHSDSGCVEASA
jgi:hypothetical protein